MREFIICFFKTLSFLCVLCLFCGSISFPAKAQVKPVYDYGAIGLGQLLKRLNNTKSVMHIGAHPDDEDSGLLAFLARGENARTAYLSLTRGDGGQNIIGSELFESLGVIRTEELLQARRLDGAEQYFTRAYDYGFSKTLAEAKTKWDEKIILCDAVRAIRSFRPLVVISRFSGTPADGHGQHQFAGYIAPLAVRAAADANQCTDAGAPWRVLKFYVGQGFRSTAEPTLRINTGAYDSLLGRSYFEIAMEGRSQHKTQEQGVLELRGQRFSNLNLVETKAPRVEKERSVFDGIDVSLRTVSPTAGDAAARSLREFDINNPQKIVSVLIEGWQAIRQTSDRQKEAEFAELIRRAAGVRTDALADRETFAPDESVFVTSRIFLADASNTRVKEIKLQSPADWQVSRAAAPTETTQGFFRSETADETAYFNVKVPKTQKFTEPFWLENERTGDVFDVQGSAIESFQPPLLNCLVTVEINGTEITFAQPIEYRFADDIRGEVRRGLNVVPKISLSLDQKLLIVSQNRQSQTKRITLNVKNNSAQKIGETGTAELKLPEGWRTKQTFGVFQPNKKGENFSLDFDIIIPANAKAGEYEIEAVARVGKEIYGQTMNTIAYPHIQTHRLYSDAKTRISVLDLKTAPAQIGYVMGSGDEVPEAIRQMGLPVELLNEVDLTSGDLSRFQTIVVGIRAFQVRQDLISNNQRLLDYVKNGGVLIVQYQRPDYEPLLPFPGKLGARTADENAPVKILDAAHAAFNFPNKITETDFANWVQERNLYAFTTFDANYKSLLEAHDAGEAENKGGLVMAEIGKGKYIYCSYAFFRQLPAGVPGAYRIFANLLALK